ncbi:MAG: 3'-5' exonuclease [Bacteroidetes bacterium]|nr:3'-5' exonuclease [Bacteroidota bacterium]
MLESLKSSDILFLDIETVPMVSKYADLPERFRKHWDLKAENLNKQDRFAGNEAKSPEDLFPRAGIYAEFGKVICISAGYIRGSEFRIKSFFGDDERKLLDDFRALLERSFNHDEHLLCAHNGKEFDFPYLTRRMLINRLRIPRILDLSGKKKWEIQHLDTMEMWKFGDFKNYTSLDLLAAAFDLPSPKDDIGGADVWKVYWEDHDLPRIVTYCQKDVLTVARLLMCFLGKETISDDMVVIKA